MDERADQQPHRPTLASCHIPQAISLSPAPCRMIAVSVFDLDDGSHDVHWETVIGLLCVVETEYVKREPGDGIVKPGANHEEMIDRGWRSQHPHNWFPEVFPVVAGGEASDEYPLRVLHERTDSSNLSDYTILICTWPPEDDRDHAIMAGEKMRDGIESSNWAILPAPAGLAVNGEKGTP